MKILSGAPLDGHQSHVRTPGVGPRVSGAFAGGFSVDSLIATRRRAGLLGTSSLFLVLAACGGGGGGGGGGGSAMTTMTPDGNGGTTPTPPTGTTTNTVSTTEQIPGEEAATVRSAYDGTHVYFTLGFLSEYANFDGDALEAVNAEILSTQTYPDEGTVGIGDYVVLTLTPDANLNDAPVYVRIDDTVVTAATGGVAVSELLLVPISYTIDNVGPDSSAGSFSFTSSSTTAILNRNPDSLGVVTLTFDDSIDPDSLSARDFLTTNGAEVEKIEHADNVVEVSVRAANQSPLHNLTVAFSEAAEFTDTQGNAADPRFGGTQLAVFSADTLPPTLVYDGVTTADDTLAVETLGFATHDTSMGYKLTNQIELPGGSTDTTPYTIALDGFFEDTDGASVTFKLFHPDNDAGPLGISGDGADQVRLDGRVGLTITTNNAGANFLVVNSFGSGYETRLSDSFVLGALDTAGNIYAHEVSLYRGLAARITGETAMTSETGAHSIVYTLDYSGSSNITKTSFISSIGTVTGVALTEAADGADAVTGTGMVWITVTLPEGAEHEGEFASLSSVGGTSPHHFPDYRHYYDNVGIKYENLEVTVNGVDENIVTVSDVSEFVVVTVDFTDGPLGGDFITGDDIVVVSGAPRFAADENAAPVGVNVLGALSVVEVRALGDHSTWAVTVVARGGDGVRSQVYFSPYDSAMPHFEDTEGNPSDAAFGNKLIAEIYVDTQAPVVTNEIANQEIEDTVARGALAFDAIALAGHFSNDPGSDPAMVQSDITFEASVTGDALLDQLRFRKADSNGQLHFEADLASDTVFGVATVTITATDGAGHTATDAFLVTREDTTPDTSAIELLSAAKEMLPVRIGQNQGYIVLAFNKGLSDYGASGAGDAELVDEDDFAVTGGTDVTLSVESYGDGSERVSLAVEAADGVDHTVYTLAFADDAVFTGENDVDFEVPDTATIITFTVDTQAPVLATGSGALENQTMAGSVDLSSAFTDAGDLTFRVTDENEGPYDASISGTNLVLTANMTSGTSPMAVMGLEQITVTAFDEVGNATRATISAQNASGTLTAAEINDVILTDPDRGQGTAGTRYFVSHTINLVESGAEVFSGGTGALTFFVGESNGAGTVSDDDSHNGMARDQADVVQASIVGNVLHLNAIPGAGIGVEAVTVTAVDTAGMVGTAEFFVHLPGVELKETLTPVEVAEGGMFTYTLEDGTTADFWDAFDVYVASANHGATILTFNVLAGPAGFTPDADGDFGTLAENTNPSTPLPLVFTAPMVFGDTVFTFRIGSGSEGGSDGDAGMVYSVGSTTDLQILVKDDPEANPIAMAVANTTVYDVDGSTHRETELDLGSLYTFATGDQGGVTAANEHFVIDYYIEAGGEQVSETTRASVPSDGMVEVHLRGLLDGVAAEHILNNETFTLQTEARFQYGNEVILNSVTLTSSEHNARTEIYNNSFVDSDNNDFLGGFGFDIHRGGDDHTKLQGQSIAGVGDYNGDGFDDFVFVNRAGKVSLVKGGRDSWSVKELPGTPTYATLPKYTNLAGGDFRHDGFGDVLAPHGGGFDQLAVRSGRADGTSGPGDYDLATHNFGESSAAVAVIGDINGDGIVDTAVTYRNLDTVAFAYSNPARGGATTIYAHNTPGHRRINDFGIRDYPNEHGEDGIETVTAPSNAFYTFLGLAGADGVPTAYFGDLPKSNAYVKDAGSVFYNASISKSGASVSGIGDINGDGIDDFAIGTPGRNANSSSDARDAGAVFVVYGRNANKHGVDDAGQTWQREDPDSREPVIASSYNENNLRETTQGFLIHAGSNGPEEHFGAVIDAAGDFNGDGYQDIVIGNDDETSGGAKRVVVFFGRSGHTGRSYDAADQLEIVSSSGGFGKSVSGIGDFNGDGFDDILVGDTTTDSGEAYVFFGQDETRANLEGALWNLGETGDDAITNDPTRMLKLSTGVSADSAMHHFGRTVEGVGDLNGDGLDDLAYGDGRGNVRVIWGNQHFGQPADSDQSGDPYNSADAIDHISDPIGRGDVVYAGAGGDTLYLNSNRAQRVDGGSGIDTLVIGRGVTLDLTEATDSSSLGRDDVRDIEKLKFYANSGSVVKLDKFSLYDLTGTSSHVDIETAPGESVTGRFLVVERDGTIAHDDSVELQLLDSHFYKEEKTNGDMYYIRTALGLGSSNGYNEFVGIWAPDAEDAAGEDNNVVVQEVAYL